MTKSKLLIESAYFFVFIFYQASKKKRDNWLEVSSFVASIHAFLSVLYNNISMDENLRIKSQVWLLKIGSIFLYL